MLVRMDILAIPIMAVVSIQRLTNCFNAIQLNWFRANVLVIAASVYLLFNLTAALAPTCDGISSTDWSCCSSSVPCSAGGGDCDYDSDCQGELICGTNNCNEVSGVSHWSTAADCCITQGKPN